MLFGTTADIGNFIALPEGPFCTFTVIVMFFVPVPFNAAVTQLQKCFDCYSVLDRSSRVRFRLIVAVIDFERLQYVPMLIVATNIDIEIATTIAKRNSVAL